MQVSACGGNSLAPKNSNKISVASEPSGASVYVMGKLAGITPVLLDSNNVFPIVYLPENEQDYGYITLRHEACSDKKIKITAGMISDGLRVGLDCVVEEAATDKSSVVERTVSQRLKQIQALKDEGLINDQEYQKIRSRILKSF